MDERFKAVITDMSIYVRKIELAPSIASKMEQKLAKSSVYYPITRSCIKKYQLHAGVTNIFIPKCMKNNNT